MATECPSVSRQIASVFADIDLIIHHENLEIAGANRFSHTSCLCEGKAPAVTTLLSRPAPTWQVPFGKLSQKPIIHYAKKPRIAMATATSTAHNVSFPARNVVATLEFQRRANPPRSAPTAAATPRCPASNAVTPAALKSWTTPFMSTVYPDGEARR